MSSWLLPIIIMQCTTTKGLPYSAQFLLTEPGHGLDAKHLETTAMLLADGSFDLHTPSCKCAQVSIQFTYIMNSSHPPRFMPPTSPIRGHPRVGLVFAKLIVGGEDRGVRPLIVHINDGTRMSAGITSRYIPTSLYAPFALRYTVKTDEQTRVMPRRAGSKMVGYSITTFTHVKLPSSALLGS
jgi:alkylation response protein AidB-like acyl-CoA dehydrogenase